MNRSMLWNWKMRTNHLKSTIKERTLTKWKRYYCSSFFVNIGVKQKLCEWFDWINLANNKDAFDDHIRISIQRKLSLDGLFFWQVPIKYVLPSGRSFHIPKIDISHKWMIEQEVIPWYTCNGTHHLGLLMKLHLILNRVSKNKIEQLWHELSQAIR